MSNLIVGCYLLKSTQVILEVYSAINNANFDTIIFYVYLPMEISLPVIVKYAMAGIPCSRATLIWTPVYSITSIVLTNLELDIYKIVLDTYVPTNASVYVLGLILFSEVYTHASLYTYLFSHVLFTGWGTSVCPYNYGYAVYSQLLALLQ